MCGIVAGYSKNKKRISKALLRRYRDQKSRGTEGFGYVAVYKDGVRAVRRETENAIEKELKQEDSPFVMFHHRFPTSTINVEECAHPIKVSHDELDYDYYVVHNGVIRNCDELKKKHEELGYKYTTLLQSTDRTLYKSALSGREYFTGGAKVVEKYNDSEALAIELARHIDGMSKTIDATGTMAFVVMQVDKETGVATKMYFGRNDGNPLHVENNRDYIWIKSQGNNIITPHTMYCMDVNTLDITEREQHIGREYPSYNSHSSHNNHVYNRDNHVDKKDDSELYRLPSGAVKSPIQREDLRPDIDFDDPAEHDYKRTGQMGFHTNNNTVVQDTLNWDDNYKPNGVSGNDDIPYDTLMKDPKVNDLIERTLRLQRMRDVYEEAVDKCEEEIHRISKHESDDDSYEWEQARREAENEIEKLDQRMLDIEGEFYNMATIHAGIDFCYLVDEYREGFSDEELDEYLGIHDLRSVTLEGKVIPF